MRFFAPTKLLIAVLAVSWSTAGVAIAETPPPPPGPQGGQLPLGLELTAVDAAARKISGIQHCVDPARAGQPVTFAVAPHVDMGWMSAGKQVGVMVDTKADPDTVVGAIDKDCRTMMPPPGGQPGPGGMPGPGGQHPGPGHGPQGELPSLDRGFLNRVWKFDGEVDGFEDGKLSMTVAKILNLPKKWRAQDDDLVDEDALVLVSKSIRVYDGGKRIAQSRLDDAEHVRVQGKLLAPSKWKDDEDGTPVTTIRAKKIFVVD